MFRLICFVVSVFLWLAVQCSFVAVAIGLPLCRRRLMMRQEKLSTEEQQAEDSSDDDDARK